MKAPRCARRRQLGFFGWKAGSSRRAVDVVISATQTTQQNIFTLAGSPSDIVDVVIWLGYSSPGVTTAGVVLRAGFTLGSGWANGSTFLLKNNSTCAGGGGFENGSTGDGGGVVGSSAGPGQDGQPGGDAIVLTAPISIDNASGFIFGGGGQGGGGGAGATGGTGAGGGGGGGGRGYNNATGGAGGGASSGGSAGNNGSSGAAGTGGTGGFSLGGSSGGNGGDGGDWGASGGAGASGSGSSSAGGGAGGAGGKAIKTNGFAVTWISGNDAAHVKGAVSP
jgi:hypothetical protein